VLFHLNSKKKLNSSKDWLQYSDSYSRTINMRFFRNVNVVHN